VHDAIHRRTAHLPPTVRGLLWSASAGLIFSVLNALMRALALAPGPVPGAVPALPVRPAGAAAAGGAQRLAAYRPKRIGGQFLRGAVHTLGLVLWFWRCRRSRWPT
jgi:hypothetical protein